MNIIQVCPRYYPFIGGVEYVVKSVAERLVKQGHKVVVVAGEPSIDKPLEEDLNGISIVWWPTHAPNNAYHIPMMRGKLKTTLISLFRNVDVVHIHSIHAAIAYYAWKSWKAREEGKLVITPYYHGGGHTFLRRSLWFVWRFYVKRMLKDADVVHTVSKLEAGLLRKDFKVNALPIENGVEEFLCDAGWKPSDYVLYAGRIEKYKNIKKLAKVVQILNTQCGKSLKFVVIGDGSYKGKLAKGLSTLDLEWKTLPFQTYESYVNYLSHASFLGLLSKKESYPQSVNEANAVRVPVVIAKPWAENFGERTRTLIVDANDGEEEIALKVLDFLEKASKQPRPEVPTWEEVANTYLTKLYT